MEQKATMVLNAAVYKRFILIPKNIPMKPLPTRTDVKKTITIYPRQNGGPAPNVVRNMRGMVIIL